MTSNEKLIEYILSLTDEQIEKIFTDLPRLTSELEAHDLPPLRKE